MKDVSWYIVTLLVIGLLLLPLPLPEDTHTRRFIPLWQLPLYLSRMEELRFRLRPLLLLILSWFGLDTSFWPIKLRVKQTKSILKFKPGDVPRKGIKAPLGRIRRILVIRPDRLGDTIVSIPLLNALRKRFEGAELVVVGGAPVEVFKDLGLADRVVKPSEVNLDEPYDLALNLQHHYGLGSKLLFKVRADWRFLFQTALPPRLPEQLASHLTVIPIETKLHVVDSLAIMGEFVTGEPVDVNLSLQPKFEPDEEEALRRKLGTSKSYVVLAPFAGVPAREWPFEMYMQVAEALKDKLEVVLVGTGPDRKRLGTEGLRRLEHLGLIDLIGQLSLKELWKVVSDAEAVLTNDTGVAHLSSFVRTPCVIIAGGLTNPVLWSPYWGRCLTLFNPTACSECYKHSCPHLSCLRAIKPEVVLPELLSLMEGSK